MIGEVIGSYRLVSELGKGGMGMVYRAEHVQLGRPAALKMLLPQLSNDASMLQRFFNEARAASAIDHPGIVEVYDFGRHTDGRAYIVMALLRGESLEHRLGRGPLLPQDSATIVAQVAGALAAAHARGIVHRDLKPDNIFLEPNDLMPGGVQVKLLDFGIAKLADDQAGFKTQTGALMGTPAYMSPEQCMGRADLDHRTDIYAVGCILFHLLCGRPPFISDQGSGMMIAAHIRDAAPDPRAFNPHLPPALAAVVLRCLEKDPAARYQSATELRNALVAAGAIAPLSMPPGSEQYAATLAAPLSAPPHVHAVSAVTTRGGAAAQIVAQPTAPGGRRSRAGLAIAGLLVVAAGVGVTVAMTRGGETRSGVAGAPPPPSGGAAPVSQPPPSGGGTAQASQSPSGAGTAPASPPPSGGGAVSTSPPAGGVAVRDPAPAGSAAQDSSPPPGGDVACPPGQTRRDDTQGHCCWPAQAWSGSASKCVGAPSCPDGMVARGEQCAAQEIARGTRRPPASSGKVAGAPRFRLSAKTYAPGDSIEIRFTGPVSSTPQSKAWVTVIEADRPASAYGAWSYLGDGATTATLKAPTQPGRYEVRLHTDYPAKTFNVQQAVSLTVGAEQAEAQPGFDVTPRSAQRFTLGATTVRGGGAIDVKFATALRAAPGEKFWITVTKADAADSSWGSYEYIPAGARRIQLTAPTAAGDYEVRLHGNYPTKTTNLVHRVAIRVDDY